MSNNEFYIQLGQRIWHSTWKTIVTFDVENNVYIQRETQILHSMWKAKGPQEAKRQQGKSRAHKTQTCKQKLNRATQPCLNKLSREVGLFPDLDLHLDLDLDSNLGQRLSRQVWSKFQYGKDEVLVMKFMGPISEDIWSWTLIWTCIWIRIWASGCPDPFGANFNGEQTI